MIITDDPTIAAQQYALRIAQLEADKAKLLVALAQGLPIMERLRAHGQPDSPDCDCAECAGRGAAVAEIRALIAKYEAKS